MGPPQGKKKAARVGPISTVILAREWIITDWKLCHGSHGFRITTSEQPTWLQIPCHLDRFQKSIPVTAKWLSSISKGPAVSKEHKNHFSGMNRLLDAFNVAWDSHESEAAVQLLCPNQLRGERGLVQEQLLYRNVKRFEEGSYLNLI